MPSALSVDLRERVVAAVEAGASQRLEAQAALILRLKEEHPSSFLRELRDRLSERGIRASPSSLSRFLDRHGITRKKGLSTRPSKSDRM